MHFFNRYPSIYVPVRLRPHLQQIYRDEDGYWVYFDDCVDVKYDPRQPCSTIHEDTTLGVSERLRRCVILSPFEQMEFFK